MELICCVGATDAKERIRAAVVMASFRCLLIVLADDPAINVESSNQISQTL
jgi:hypothetical protein